VSFRSALLAGLAAVSLLATQAAASPLTWTSVVGGAPTGATRTNFDSLVVGGPSGQVTATGITVLFAGTAGIVQNLLTNRHAPPSLSGGNGQGFGPGGGNQPNGANATPYLTSGSTRQAGNSALTLLFPFEVAYLGLLWGSVDAGNALAFYEGDMLVGTILGSQVAALPNGDQGPGGTRYVNVTSTMLFDRVVATSPDFAFELDNVAFSADPGVITTVVPEPASLALLGAGLFGLGLVARRRPARVAAA
jgi:hypothetical protein